MKLIRYSTAIAAAVLLAFPASPASAAATTVDEVATSGASVPAGSAVTVTGTVTFGSDVQVIGTDPSGDIEAARAAAGMDLTEARIASDPAKPNDLVWTIKTAGLPPGIDAVPEVVFYWWNFNSPDGEEFGYDARRTNAYRQLNANTFFRVRRCPGGSCSDAFTPINGVFDQATGEIRSTFRVSQIQGGAPGAQLTMGGIESSHGTGARWVYGLGDSMFAEVDTYTIPGADVQVGIAPAGGTPTSFQAAIVGSGAAPGYQAQVSTAGLSAGAYDVVVKACWGSNCGEARTPLTVT